MNPQSGHTHKIIKCKRCERVVTQCPCIDQSKVVEHVNSCDQCDKTIYQQIPKVDEQQRRARIHGTVAIKINDFVKQHGIESVGLATFGWLVDAQITIEQLRTALFDLFVAERNKVILDGMLPKWNKDSAMGQAEQLLDKLQRLQGLQ